MHVFCDNTQHKIHSTSDNSTLYHFGHTGDGAFKFFHIYTVRQSKFHGDEDFEIKS